MKLIVLLAYLLCRVLSVEWDDKTSSGMWKHRVVTQFGDTGYLWSSNKYLFNDTIRIPYTDSTQMRRGGR